MKLKSEIIPLLPLEAELESKTVLKKLAHARAALSGLNGISETIPNEGILISTLALQEAKDSSAIENIVTTHDELYSSDSANRQFTSIAAKEVYNYAFALQQGFHQVKKSGLLTGKDIIRLQAALEENDAGYRKLPGTALKNEQTGEVVYTPPQSHDEIKLLMANLEKFMNNSALSDLDPVIKMAIIHHQFESIHPFYDGNGRTGRIVNILYLVKEGLLSLPILYLSRYINHNKADYYRLLQHTRETKNWEPWIMYMLDAVEKTAVHSTQIIRDIKILMGKYKHQIRQDLKKIYSQDLINSLFRHPYTKIEFIKRDLGVTRKTAARYLEQLCDSGLLHKNRWGKENYYFNNELIELLSKVNSLRTSQTGTPKIITSKK